jgi:hypothetical protein
MTLTLTPDEARAHVRERCADILRLTQQLRDSPVELIAFIDDRAKAIDSVPDDALEKWIEQFEERTSSLNEVAWLRSFRKRAHERIFIAFPDGRLKVEPEALPSGASTWGLAEQFFAPLGRVGRLAMGGSHGLVFEWEQVADEKEWPKALHIAHPDDGLEFRVVFYEQADVSGFLGKMVPDYTEFAAEPAGTFEIFTGRLAAWLNRVRRARFEKQEGVP